MKTKMYLLVGSLLAIFTSCDKNSDSSLSSLTTDLKISIPYSNQNSDNLKSLSSGSEQVYTFSGDQVFTPNSIVTNSGTSNVRKFEPLDGAKLSLPNIQNVEALQSLYLEWGFETIPGNFTLQNSIDLLALNHSLQNGKLEVSLGNSLVQMIETMDSNYNTTFKVSIKGNSNLALVGVASLVVPVIVKTGTLNPRYELW